MIFARFEDQNGKWIHVVARDRQAIEREYTGERKVIQRHHNCVQFAFVKRRDLEQMSLPLLREGIRAVSEEGHDFFVIW